VLVVIAGVEVSAMLVMTHMAKARAALGPGDRKSTRLNSSHK
jgi:hypothetical protein